MNKKVVSFLILCVGAVVSGVILSYGLSHLVSYTLPPDAIETSLAEIFYSPSVWVNGTVVVEGNLSGPYAYALWAPPYNHGLTELEETRRYIQVGVLWDGSNYSGKVMLVGVVRKGYWTILGEKGEICYYIEAQVIRKL